MRLDAYLVTHNYGSRSRAKLLIEDGAVSVNGIITTKVSKTISPADVVTVIDSIPYVSRAGLKLEHALKAFEIDATGATCLDIGSSTGGFTDCLLKHGAVHVDAVDVGTDQFAEVLKHDARIRLYEKTDIRTFTSDRTYDLIVCDASFISLTKIIPVLPALSHAGTRVVLLIKPQFEVGKDFIGKGGIVTDTERITQVIADIVSCASEHSLNLTSDISTAGIKGGDGNQEYCAYFTYSKKSV